MNKQYKITIDGIEDYISFYNGIFNLSPTEINILAEFVKIDRDLKSANVDINPFSTDMKKKVAKQLGRNDFNTLNNYIKSLCEKGAISSVEDGYKIHPMFTTIGVEFVIFKLDYIDEQE